MTKEEILPFWGKVSLADTFPMSLDLLPAEARQYISADQDQNEKYILAQEDGEIIGFTVIQLPLDKSDSVHLGYRYVFPEHRRRGVGKILRDKTYELCFENGFHKVESGINNVIRLSPDGEVTKNLDEKSDGGWKSYYSMSESKAKINIEHRIKFVTIDDRGNVSFAAETTLGSELNDLLPNEPDAIVPYLKRIGVLPEDVDVAQLATIAQGKNFVVYKDGREISFQEFVSMLRSR